MEPGDDVKGEVPGGGDANSVESGGAANGRESACGGVCGAEGCSGALSKWGVDLSNMGILLGRLLRQANIL